MLSQHDALDTPLGVITAGIATAHRVGRTEDADRLRKVLKATRVANTIREAVNSAPELTSAQIETLRGLFPTPSADKAEAA